MGRRSSRFLSNRKEMCIQLFTRKDGVKGTNRKNTITTTSPAQAISTPSRSNPLPPEPQKDHQALLVGVSKMSPKFWTPHPSISNHIYKIHHSCISTTSQSIKIWKSRSSVHRHTKHLTRANPITISSHERDTRHDI